MGLFTPLSVARAICIPNVSKIVESPRFRTLNSNLYEPVRRPDLSGSWLCKGPPGEAIPPASCDKVMYYLHGGAYGAGHPAQQMATFLRVAEIAAEENIIIAIFGLSYSFAPEAHFPKPMDQAVVGYKYLLEDCHIDPSKIAMIGDSSGGHLSLCLALVLREKGLPSPRAGFFLISPWLDLLCSSEGSYTRNKNRDFLDAASLTTVAKQALQSDTNGGNSRFTSFLQPLTGGQSWRDVLLGKVWLSAGGDEIFLSDIVNFADILKKDGVDVELDLSENKVHTWQWVSDAFDSDKYIKTPGPSCPEGIMQGAANIGRAIVGTKYGHE